MARPGEDARSARGDPGPRFPRAGAVWRIVRPVGADDPATPALRRPARQRQPQAAERPRRLLAGLGRAGFALGGRLPYGAAFSLGGALGRAAWRLSRRNREITRVNLALCLPELGESERERIARASLVAAGRVVCELPGIWQRPRARTLALVREVRGAELVERARAAGRGVLVISPHQGDWELGGLLLSTLGPLTSMYKPPRVQGLGEFYRERRARFGAKLVPADGNGVRSVIAALRAGEIVGMLPDQDPGFGSGIFVPYFGVLANTSSLVPKLLRKTGAAALLTSTLRLDDGSGFHSEYRQASEELRDADEERATTAMNRELETLVRACPEQYLWSYKRFKARPPGGERFYDGI